jgi:hypothetical protein
LREGLAQITGIHHAASSDDESNAGVSIVSSTLVSRQFKKLKISPRQERSNQSSSRLVDPMIVRFITMTLPVWRNASALPRVFSARLRDNENIPIHLRMIGRR